MSPKLGVANAFNLPMLAFSVERVEDWPVILQSLEHTMAVVILVNLVGPAKKNFSNLKMVTET